MKLVMTIISNKDTERVMTAVADNGYFATRISTTGQFLVDGHTAILIACDEERVEKLYDILKQHVTKRMVKTQGVTSTLHGSLLKQAVDVEEGGAVAFTMDIENFQKF
ncbi:MAG: cyclic-di-AMP receptor [Eubacterium sp.]|nr:cyclic-di-AMP receptor [Eubacterium sp.]